MSNFEDLQENLLTTDVIDGEQEWIDQLNALPEELVGEIITVANDRGVWLKRNGLTNEKIDRNKDWQEKLNSLPHELVREIIIAARTLRGEGGQDFS